MSQKQIEKPAPQEQEKPAEVSEAKNLRNEELAKSTDDVLQEIDDLMEDVLGEGTALAFVTNYLQRGGE